MPGATRWIAWLGAPGNEGQVAARLRRELGGRALAVTLPGAVLAAVPPVAIRHEPDGGLSLTDGDPEAEGCRIEMRPGPELAVTRGPFGAAGVFLARAEREQWLAPTPLAAAALAGLPAVADPVALHGYVCFSFVPTPQSVSAGVEALPAGLRVDLTPWSALCCGAGALHDGPQHPLLDSGTEGGGVRSTRSPAPLLPHPAESDTVAALGVLLRQAVARRLRGAGPAGVFLSGGLDSALVTALLRETGVTVRAYTLDFGPPHDIELPYARAVAMHLGVPLTVVPARGREIARALAPTAAALAQPYGDAVTAPLWLLGEAAARDVDVVFNGEGGDQLFGGWANKPMIAAALYGGPALDEEAGYLATFHRFHGLTDALYTPAARARIAGCDAGAWVRPALAGADGLLHRLRAANLALKGAQNIAPRAAHLAAAHSLRLEMPFFDRALAEWSFTLPDDLLLRGACEKYVLKRFAASLLPEAVVWREKRGMGVPATDWLLGPLRREVAQRLSAGRLRREGWLRPEAVAPLLRGEDLPGEYRRRRAGEKLWALLMLHLWGDLHGVALGGV